MKRSRFTEEQIIGFIKQAEAGMPVKELCRKGGFSDVTFYIYGLIILWSLVQVQHGLPSCKPQDGCRITRIKPTLSTDWPRG